MMLNFTVNSIKIANFFYLPGFRVSAPKQILAYDSLNINGFTVQTLPDPSKKKMGFSKIQFATARVTDYLTSAPFKSIWGVKCMAVWEGRTYIGGDMESKTSPGVPVPAIFYVKTSGWAY